MTIPWPILQPDVDSILVADPDPLARLANGDVAAIVIRQAFPAEQCRSLVRLLIDEQLMYESGDPRIDEKAIAPERSDRWTKSGTNPAKSSRRRIDIGTSLGNYGDDREFFFGDSAKTHQLFDRLFAERPNPIAMIYEMLSRLVPGKSVMTAREPDGKQYSPAIIRIHYGGYTYGPHFDSVRNRENRRNYAVYQFDSQFAGVLCMQNTTQNGVSAQGIVHRQFWNPEIDPLLKAGRFGDYAAEHDVAQVQIDLEPGDLYFFNTGMIHEVPGVAGDLPRIVLATFIGYSDDIDEIMVWS